MGAEQTALLSDRQRVEAAIYNTRVHEAYQALEDTDLMVDCSAPPFPNREHVEFLTFAMERLGPLAGQQVLEVGCGTGSLSVYLAHQQAHVTGIDVSEEAVRVAQRRAAANGVAQTSRFRAVPAEDLDDPDGTYDLIMGNQVLHHLELKDALPNLRRLLRVGGRGVFCEPVLLLPSWGRRIRESSLVTGFLPRHVDTPTERSLSSEDIAFMGAVFPGMRKYPFQLFARVQNFMELGDAWFARVTAVDRFLLKRFPPLWVVSRFLVLEIAR
jgi:2-polyprenyl-3-methyl-5-hydroxy-6-metoxy-1,4-benzoquinol methylase